MRNAGWCVCFLSILSGIASGANIFGSLRGIIHDPHHRPVQGAMVMLHAKSSDWSRTANSSANGEFEFGTVPLGEYTVSVANPGFVQAVQSVTVRTNSEPVLHFSLKVESANETVTVSALPMNFSCPETA